MEYVVYVLYSSILDRYYIGTTQDITIRLKEHLKTHKGFTGWAKDWVVIYTETFDSKTAAYARERQIKSWKSRKMLEKLIGK